MPDTTTQPDPVTASLSEWRQLEQAASPGPWRAEASHGRDIADESWSDCRVKSADGEFVAVTYLTNIAESGCSEENESFIVAARSAVPRLLAAVEAAREVHHLRENPLMERGQNPHCGACGKTWPCADRRAIDAAITRELLGETL